MQSAACVYRARRGEESEGTDDGESGSTRDEYEQSSFFLVSHTVFMTGGGREKKKKKQSGGNEALGRDMVGSSLGVWRRHMVPRLADRSLRENGNTDDGKTRALVNDRNEKGR